MKKNPVVHFEMPAEDKKRMTEFYAKVFGWESQQLGPEMGNYVVVQTTETGDGNRPVSPGAINGGFFDKTDATQHPRITIAVDDIYQALKEVEEAGGQVLGGSQGADKPDDIPGVGLYATIIDTEGNRVSLLQPKR